MEGFVLNGILGGITGIFGNAITSWFKHKTAKEDNRHEEKMVDLESQATVAEVNANIKRDQIKIEGEIDLADAKAYEVSQKVGQAPLFAEAYMKQLFEPEGRWAGFRFFCGTVLIICFGIVDVFRGVMRPGLTSYLLGPSTWLTVKSYLILGKVPNSDPITAVQASAIFQDAVNTIIYLTVSCVTWWFGDRRMEKYLMEQKAKRLNGGGTYGAAPF